MQNFVTKEESILEEKNITLIDCETFTIIPNDWRNTESCQWIQEIIPNSYNDTLHH